MQVKKSRLFVTHRIAFFQTKIPRGSWRSRSAGDALLLHLTADGVFNGIVLGNAGKSLLGPRVPLGRWRCWQGGPLGPARHYRHIEATAGTFIRGT